MLVDMEDDTEYPAIGQCPQCNCPLLDPARWAEGFLDFQSELDAPKTLYTVKCPVCGQLLVSTPEVDKPPDEIEWTKPLN
jgi:hypothetical protein